MATVTKCDRCGQYVDRISDSLPHIIYRKNQDFNTLAHHVDLCQECHKNFLEWLKPFNQDAQSKVVSEMVDRETEDVE